VQSASAGIFKGRRTYSQGYLREEELTEQIKLKLLEIWINDKTAKLMLKKLNDEINSKDNIFLSVILKKELSEINKKQEKLLDLCISGIIDEKEYQDKKEKLIQRKYEIKSRLANLEGEVARWIEPMRDFIITCNSVSKAIRENDRFKLREICQKTGSNFKIKDRKLTFDFLNPYSLVKIHKKAVGELPVLHAAKPHN